MKSRKRAASLPPPWLVEGAMVDYHAVIGGPITEFNLRARTMPQQMSSGHWVIYLDGKFGCVTVVACTPATGSLGPSNDGSLEVYIEMRAVRIEATRAFTWSERVGWEAHELNRSIPVIGSDAALSGQLVGWLARELATHPNRETRDATAWAWDTSRPLAEQLAETAADDAAADAMGVDGGARP